FKDDSDRYSCGLFETAVCMKSRIPYHSLL
ncbi:uncharacterized protein METZ01_LOCUS150371, partial [marine metagenome]